VNTDGKLDRDFIAKFTRRAIILAVATLVALAMIVVLLIGGDLLGFLGLIVAVPVTAIVQAFVKEILERYRASALHSGAMEVSS